MIWKVDIQLLIKYNSWRLIDIYANNYGLNHEIWPVAAKGGQRGHCPSLNKKDWDNLKIGSTHTLIFFSGRLWIWQNNCWYLIHVTYNWLSEIHIGERNVGKPSNSKSLNKQGKKKLRRVSVVLYKNLM